MEALADSLGEYVTIVYFVRCFFEKGFLMGRDCSGLFLLWSFFIKSIDFKVVVDRNGW